MPKDKGYDVTGQATASSKGIQGERTADLSVSGMGKVDVYTPEKLNSTSIARGIEGKSTQAPVVVVRGDISNGMMQEVASRVWGKPNAQAIKTVIFERKGELVTFQRPE